jgi:deoxyribonuclease IV
MTIRFGPAGLGPVKTALEVLERYHKLGLKACEIAFTYSVYIKPEEAKIIGEKAKELDIELSIHAPYFVNLNSSEKEKIEATKKRILHCCEIGELLGAKVVVFHPGYYSNKGKSEEDKKETYDSIKKGIEEILDVIKKNKWMIKIAPETMGKVNVFGSVEEISMLVKETGCAFCIDFAHILAREKKVDYEKVINLFPQKEWHVHFSGIVYGDKGEKHHISTEKSAWKELLENLPKDKTIRIVNESPTLFEDSIDGLKIWEKIENLR